MFDSMRTEPPWLQWEMKNGVAHRVEKTDSSAALRNDKQKDEQRQKQRQMRGFFPFDYAQGQNDNF
jgi:hypothetical protein